MRFVLQIEIWSKFVKISILVVLSILFIFVTSAFRISQAYKSLVCRCGFADLNCNQSSYEQLVNVKDLL